jgi:hypothetical protein
MIADHKPRVLIFVVTYHAESTIVGVLERCLYRVVHRVRHAIEPRKQVCVR